MPETFSRVIYKVLSPRQISELNFSEHCAHSSIRSFVKENECLCRDCSQLSNALFVAFVSLGSVTLLRATFPEHSV